MAIIKTKKPEFFCVGAAKSGTSALQHFLRQHPDIFMPELKEIHHFAPDLLSANDPWLDEQKYLSLFIEAKKNQVIGETSVFYLLSETSAQLINKTYPHASIIIMIRNPLEVMYSLHSQLVYNGEENILDFEKALLAEEERKAGMNLPKKTRIQQKHLYFHVCQFAEQILRFMEYFNDDHLHFILYDDFKKDTLNEVQKVFRFLGVDDSFIPEIKLINANKKIRNRTFQKLHYYANYHFFSKIFSENNLIKLNAYLLNLNTKYYERNPLDKELENRLKELLKPEIDKLSELFDRDLSHWYESN